MKNKDIIKMMSRFEKNPGTELCYWEIDLNKNNFSVWLKQNDKKIEVNIQFENTENMSNFLNNI